MKLIAEAWGQFGNPRGSEMFAVEAVTRQRLMKT
jgi:hypothetical protein